MDFEIRNPVLQTPLPVVTRLCARIPVRGTFYALKGLMPAPLGHEVLYIASPRDPRRMWWGSHFDLEVISSGFHGFGIRKGTRSTTYKPLDNHPEECYGLLGPSVQVPAAFAHREGASAALLGGPEAVQTFIDYIIWQGGEKQKWALWSRVKAQMESTSETQGIIFDDFRGSIVLPGFGGAFGAWETVVSYSWDYL
ncbi:hypothetical protein FA13DRAFT_1706658 [Coprinellus micaceus]|uniref:Uncharacterized protein n=1 Tax=Coprinellus micaceus TaxID=71717 RepID=A0A4Y7TM91_COPMI|nr:hypothetical protein FA13DRAFT_1706658 [Coprinellus micaceus]